MERIIRVVYNPPVSADGILIQKHRDYYTNSETLEEAIAQVKIEMEKFISVLGGEIVSIEQI